MQTLVKIFQEAECEYLASISTNKKLQRMPLFSFTMSFSGFQPHYAYAIFVLGRKLVATSFHRMRVDSICLTHRKFCYVNEQKNLTEMKICDGFQFLFFFALEVCFEKMSKGMFMLYSSYAKVMICFG